MNQKRKERIQALADKLKQLQAQQIKADSRQRTKEVRRSRKDDLRRKILAGAVVLACVEDGRLSKTEFHAWLDQALERAEDRALFGLGTRAESSADAGAPDSAMPATHASADSLKQGHNSTE